MLKSASEVAFMAAVLSKPTQLCQIVKVFCVSLWAISNNQSPYHTKTCGSGQPSEQQQQGSVSYETSGTPKAGTVIMNIDVFITP